jgi:hypothetical protein
VVQTPTNFTASATPHTVGSYQQIVGSTAQPVAGMWISAEVTIVGVAATDTSMLMNIAFGASGSEVIQVTNIPFGHHDLRIVTYIPLYVPQGVEIRGQIQGAVVSDIYDPQFVLVYGGRAGAFGGYSIADTIGVNTATSGPTTGDLTDNAWDEAVASTAQAYRALTFHPCGVPGDTTAQSDTFTVDVGVGAAGVEQALATWTVRTNSSEAILMKQGPAFLEVEIPSGSRLALRKNSTSDLSAALIGWA